MTAAYAYRIEDRLVSAGVDEFDNPLGPAHVQVYIHKYEILSVTPKGFWIKIAFGKRFVLRDARKKYACETLAGAMGSFQARKNAQISILERRKNYALTALMKAIQEVKSYETN